MEHETTLPRDDFSTRLRGLMDNPGTLRAASTVQLSDFYGNAETWAIETFRVGGDATAFVQRIAVNNSLRLVLPPEIMATLARQADTLVGKSRRRGARQAIATRIARGDSVGNPDALRKVRKRTSAK